MQIYIYIYICSNFKGSKIIDNQLLSNLEKIQQIWQQVNRQNKTLYIFRALVIHFLIHDDVIKWNHFPRYWPFVSGIHRSRWIPRTKASDAELWCFLWSAWINDWVNTREAGDLRRHRGHYDVNVMIIDILFRKVNTSIHLHILSGWLFLIQLCDDAWWTIILYLSKYAVSPVWHIIFFMTG